MSSEDNKNHAAFVEIVSVIGFALESPEFKNLVTALREHPLVSVEDRLTFCDFSQHGLECVLISSKIEHVLFIVNTDSTESGKIKPYRANFLCGVESGDTRAQVLAKFTAAKITPTECEAEFAIFKVEGFQLYFSFVNENRNAAISVVEVRRIHDA